MDSRKHTEHAIKLYKKLFLMTVFGNDAITNDRLMCSTVKISKGYRKHHMV